MLPPAGRHAPRTLGRANAQGVSLWADVLFIGFRAIS
jgi:hypothetical protein